MRCVTYLLLALALARGAPVSAQSNIDPDDKFGWGENIGWTNWRDANSTSEGIVVGSRFMGGFIWAENVGWINLGDGTPANGVSYANIDGTDSGVNIDSDGDLHGFAWGENIGFVSFDGGAMATPPLPARIECDSRLTGYVWGENVGWINLDDATHFVAVDAVTTPVDCDMDHDGVPNGDDIALFVEYLMNSGADWRDVCSGDLETPSDGTIDLDDVTDFVACLVS